MTQTSTLTSLEESSTPSSSKDFTEEGLTPFGKAMLILVCTGLIVLSCLSLSRSWSVFALVLAIISCVILVAVIRSWNDPEPVVATVADEGFTLHHRHEPLSILWPDILSVYRLKLDRSVNGMRSSPYRKLRLELSSGELLKIPNGFCEGRELHDFIDNYVTRVQLIAALKRFALGESVVFGMIESDVTGLHKTPNGGVIRWDEITSIRQDLFNIKICTSSWLPAWHSEPIEGVPNSSCLILLAKVMPTLIPESESSPAENVVAEMILESCGYQSMSNS